MEDVKPPNDEQLEEPIQFGLAPLFFLTAFFAALVMVGVEGYRPLSSEAWLAPTAKLSGKMLVFAGLAFLMAVATVISMVRPRQSNAEQRGDDAANSLAPKADKH